MARSDTKTSRTREDWIARAKRHLVVARSGISPNEGLRFLYAIESILEGRGVLLSDLDLDEESFGELIRNARLDLVKSHLERLRSPDSVTSPHATVRAMWALLEDADANPEDIGSTKAELDGFWKGDE